MNNFSEQKPSENLRLSFPELMEMMFEMDYIFNQAELDAFDEDINEKSLPRKICYSTFWVFSDGENDQTNYTPAVVHYLNNHWRHTDFTNFEDYLSHIAISLYKCRSDRLSVRDLLMFFLHKNLEHLKKLYVLDQKENLQVDPTSEALNTCLANYQYFISIQRNFSSWVLEEWLPFHLKYFHRQIVEKARQEEQAKGNRRLKPTADDGMEP